jgi:hypothetical protein
MGRFCYGGLAEKTNVGVGLAFFELLHIRGAIFGGEKAKFWPVKVSGVPGRGMWVCGGRLLARISSICLLELRFRSIGPIWLEKISQPSLS